MSTNCLRPAWLVAITLIGLRCPAVADEPKSGRPSQVPSIAKLTSQLAQLTPASAQLAQILDTESDMSRLNQICQTEGIDSIHALSIRQRLLHRIVHTLLEAESIEAKIDFEIAYADEAREKLETQRDHAITMNDLANFMSSGAIASSGASVQIANNVAGNLVQAAGGLTSISLSARSLLKERGPRPFAARGTVNMLAKALGYNTPEDRDYPISI